MLLRLVTTLLIEGERYKRATGTPGTMSAPYSDLDPRIVISGLWQEVHEGVQKSHGSNSIFAAEVWEWGVQSGSVNVAPTVSAKDREREWSKLRKLADESQRDATAGC